MSSAISFVKRLYARASVSSALRFSTRLRHGAPCAFSDPRLLTILYDFLGEHVKLELMTVINSPPGSGDQRWHQGWRYLFHPEERLPPYAVVVTLPLTDVSIARVATCSEVLAHSQEKTPVSSRAVQVRASLPTSLALLSMS